MCRLYIYINRLRVIPEVWVVRENKKATDEAEGDHGEHGVVVPVQVIFRVIRVISVRYPIL